MRQDRRLAGQEHDLAELAPRRKALVGLLDLIEAVCGQYGYTDPARLDEREHVALDESLRQRLLLERPRAEGRTVDSGALAHERDEADLRLRPPADADDRDPAADGKRVQVAGHVGSAHQLEHDVERAMLLEVLRADDGRAELLDFAPQLLVAHGGRDERTGRMAELDRRGTDAARAAVHQQPLAGLQAGLREERVVCGREALGEGAG